MKRVTIIIQVDIHEGVSLPKDARYVASATNKEYRGIVEAGSSIGDAIRQLGESIVFRESNFKTRPSGRKIPGSDKGPN